MSHRFLEDSATADIAFEAEGQSLEELFRSAADATMNVMVEELDSIRPTESRRVELENPELDLLLFDLLQEQIYHKDAHQLLLRCGSLRVFHEGDAFKLTGELEGETLNPARHQQRVDVKAVTLHQFRVERAGNIWRAHVILDI